MIGSRLPRYPVDIQTRFQYFTRLQGPNTSVECFWRGDVEKSSEIIDRLAIRTDIDTGQFEKRSDFTSERKPIFTRRIEKRLDPKSIACQKKGPITRIINCQGKHSP